MSTLRDRLNAQRKAIADRNAAFARSYRFKQGKTMIRLLPGTKDVDDFSKPYGAHYIKDLGDDHIICVVGDAEICYGKVDPVREAIASLVQQFSERGDDVSAGKVKDWLAKSNYVTNVEILAGADQENKGKVVQVEFSSTQYDAILSVIDTMLIANPNFTMDQGIGIVVERTGTTKNDTKYTFTAFPTALPPPAQATLDARMDLDSYVDSKFGMQVTKALNVLSSFLGRDVSQTAIGQSLQANVKPALQAPAEPAPATQTAPAAADDLEAILAGDNVPATGGGTSTVVDAEFADLAAIPEPAPTQAAAPAAATADEFESILADLDNL